MLPRLSPSVLAAGVLLLALAGAALLQTMRLSDAHVELAQARAKHAAHVAAVAAEAASAAEAARVEEQRRHAALKEIEDRAQKDLEIARADALRARAAADRLRDAAGRYAADHCGGAAAADPAASAGSAPAAGPGLVLSDLFGRADDRAGDLAATADAARAAGLACERAYDALIAEGT